MRYSLLRYLRADFARNSRLFDRATVLAFRLNQSAHRSRLKIILKPLVKILDLFWIQGVIGAELPGSIECGPGLRLPHGGRGVIINANAKIGAGVTIYHRVTIGQSGSDTFSVPKIESDVYLGTGATLFGGITVGRGAKIGAGAVVSKDVPSGKTAVGVPAKFSLS
ncbi:serine O-acetyltransferase [Arthrobacter sp. 4R501]|uniref:serine O-acetyltransferase n=1 Tax=Arthrobacter sp. 4R501 TaxID=2058886 RepID=UPI000CE46D54|nr:serine acetyltransferase [Arthrobacter sp. 4R501]